jgi:hypothetical protein
MELHVHDFESSFTFFAYVILTSYHVRFISSITYTIGEIKMRNIHETIDKLRDAPNHEIDLPKGVAVGLLVGIEDALSKLRHVKTMVKTKNINVNVRRQYLIWKVHVIVCCAS